MIELSRRSFLGGLVGVTAANAVSNSAVCIAGTPKDSGTALLPCPNSAQLDWQNFELGILYSLDLPVFAPGGWGGFDAVRAVLDPRIFNPPRLDTDQWLAAAKALGAKYAVFTATHHNGFLNWQSDLYPYGLKQTPWRHGKGDLVRDFVESSHRHGVKPALFLSCYVNAYWKVSKYRANWGEGGAQQATFNHICEQMVEELCSRYGPLAEIWFDAGLLSPEDGGPNVLPIIDKYQPNVVFYHSPQRAQHRWIGNEAGVAGSPCWATMPDPSTVRGGYPAGWNKLLPHGDPTGAYWSPAMVDVPIRDHEWFWRPNDEHKILPLSRLVDMYYTSVGRNCTFILGATPGPDGLVPEPDFRRFADLGKEIRRRFGQPAAQTQGEGLTLELDLPRPSRVNHLVLMENIAKGERVREYTVQGLTPGNTWVKVAGGTSIGHKHIHRFAAFDVARLRFRCTSSRANPQLLKFAAYNVEGD